MAADTSARAAGAAAQAAEPAPATPGMRAADVGRAARQDLQFRIPRRPVVRRGVRMRRQDDAWVLDGGRKSQVLGGAFARDHLGALLEACDGSRTLDQIGETTGIGLNGAFEAVSLLWTGGIVEEGDTAPLPDPQPAPELACLLSRLGDSTGVNDSWQDAARRLAAARVAVTGDAALAGELVDALDPTLEARAAAGAEPGDTLAVVVETPAGDAARGAAERCWALGVPLLRVRAEHEAVTVGPYIDPSFSPCLECATAGEPGAGTTPGPDRRDLAVGLAARAVAALIARATTTHLPGDARRIDLETFTHTDRPVATRPGCPVCSVAGRPGAPGGIREPDGADGPPVPVAPAAPVGARYEQAVAIPPAAFVDSKGHQQHYKPSNLRLQREFRDWPTCPRTPLPDADLERLERPWPPAGAGQGADAVVPGSNGPDGGAGAPAGAAGRGGDPGASAEGAAPGLSAGRPTLAELATVLALAVGVREPLRPQPQGAEASADAPKLRRWTAAGGNIGSVTAYVLVPDGAPAATGVGSDTGLAAGAGPAGASAAAGAAGAGPAGATPAARPAGSADGADAAAGADPLAPLAPGVYTYIERDHVLARVAPPPGAPAVQGGAGVRLVLTGNVDKLSKKYMSFGLRLAVQDCGCSLEVVRLVARCLGLPLRARARWDERELAAAIGADPRREPVVAVVDLGAPGDSQVPAGSEESGGRRAH